MFKQAAVMVLLSNNNTLEICKIETDKRTQEAINKCFSEAYSNLILNKEKIRFDGNYKPETDEILSIKHFQMDEKILKAVMEPSSICTFYPRQENQENIKAIFVGMTDDNGKNIRIAFQKFKKEQYINTKAFNLFFDRNTFVEEKRFGISISDCIDCVYENGELLFDSYFMARQIFDLREYYRVATDGDLVAFKNIKAINIEDSNLFIEQADSRIRKKIASIMDSGLLERYTAKEIQEIGKRTGVKIPVENKRVVIPTDKKQMKRILAFLDEEVYKGVFSNDTYITNSKRVIS